MIRQYTWLSEVICKNINDLSFEENSSEELYLAVSDFVDILDKKNFSLNQKQKIFN